MADDPTLKHLFRELDAESPAIDLKRVLRRSRTRRLPAQLGVGAASLAVVGAVIVGVGAGVGGIGTGGGSADSAAMPENELNPSLDQDGAELSTLSEGASDLGRAPAEKLNLCEGAVTEVAPSDLGLSLQASFPDAAAGDTTLVGTVTLENTTNRAITATPVASPAMTLARDGITVWHTNGASDSTVRAIDLAPGASIDFEARVDLVECSVEDDLSESFRTALPSVPAGQYTVSAAIEVEIDDITHLVTSPPLGIQVR